MRNGERRERGDLAAGCPPEPEGWRSWTQDVERQRAHDAWLFGPGGRYETEIDNAVRFLGKGLAALGLPPDKVAVGVERFSYGLLSVWYERELWYCVHSGEYSRLPTEDRWEQALDLLKRKFDLELPENRRRLAVSRALRARCRR